MVDFTDLKNTLCYLWVANAMVFLGLEKLITRYVFKHTGGVYCDIEEVYDDRFRRYFWDVLDVRGFDHCPPYLEMSERWHGNG